ncbi:MAG: hypothetical protein A2017_13290 [Lentisphaerae bacterium GWF2_44_16]|nr:MAG: hypothetical protein A2017_13290 [Lentisphaerae bacterium GWF2_44_16]
MKHLNSLSFFRHWYARIIIHRGSPEYIARGMSAGLFCAFGVPVMQMPTAFVLCIFFKGAKIPAMAATWVTNWVTAPVIFPTQIYIGGLIIQQNLSWEKIKYTQSLIMNAASMRESISILWGLSTEMLSSFLVGGLALGCIWACGGYFVTLFAVKKYRQAKSLRQKRKTEDFIAGKAQGPLSS